MFYLSRGEQVAFVVLLALLLAGAGALTYAKLRPGRHPVGQPIFVPAPTGGPGRRIVVRVSGAVPRPGVYGLPAGAHLEDAIAIAGGATERAALAALDLTAPLHDGERVLVPYRVHETAAEGEQPPAEPVGAVVSLNRASRQELEALPGIGPVYAERIIVYRQKKMREEGRGFQSADELLNVPGIGPKRFAAVRDLVAP
jgi:competence protein ComEA